ncbi:MAG: hypothetical protein DRQ51_01095 [Gammaproteobacteria bacterium]|nr:MAG: hypothetical protein DRQ51_01095 [Gammaproteobacteria bacterium]
MNPLKSIPQTIVLGFALSLILAFVFKSNNFNLLELSVWLHVIFGIVWIGLLYYFNFIQVPAMADALADKNGPGPAAIGKYVAPKALLWFRWAALATWITGITSLEAMAPGTSLKAFMLQPGFEVIGIGAYLGSIMLFNVWVLIWPNQKKILGLGKTKATPDQINGAKVVALYASRINTILSIPLLLTMTAYGHGMVF